MEPNFSTTPFGWRVVTLAMVAANASPPEAVVHKWQIFRAICEGRGAIARTDRALAVLYALLTWHPETTLTGEDMVVFPTDRQITLGSHGMAPATLRRHLPALVVDCGLIIRRDSPNDKRYARKGQGAPSRTRSASISRRSWLQRPNLRHVPAKIQSSAALPVFQAQAAHSTLSRLSPRQLRAPRLARHAQKRIFSKIWPLRSRGSPAAFAFAL